MDVYAPGVIKLLGEHAVVYGKLSVTATIGMRAHVGVGKTNNDTLVINLNDLGITQSFDSSRLDSLYADYKGSDITDFISRNHGIDGRLLPYATIAARLAGESKLRVVGLAVNIDSSIPVQKGLASSAACATAYTVALANTLGFTASDSDMIDIARDGERVAHANRNAGGMDVSTTFYGGVVSYSKDNGAKDESAIAGDFEIVLIDTGPKKSTAETVGHVAQLYKDNRPFVEQLLEKINSCSVAGLDALRKGDMAALGKCMYEDQDALKSLGVSSDGLDRAVEIGRSVGAYGVKLSGGGGGGIAIALTPDPEALVNAAQAAGFKASVTRIKGGGARMYLNGAHDKAR